MSERIRSLEDALRICHAERCGSSEDAHPLLQPEFLAIKSTVALYGGVQPLSVDTEPKNIATKHYSPEGSSSPETKYGDEESPTIPNYSLFPLVSGKIKKWLYTNIIFFLHTGAQTSTLGG